MAARQKKPAKSRKGVGGRPSKILADDVMGKVVAALHAGAYIETAAAYAGLHKDTFYAWLKRGARARAACLSEATGKYNYKKIPKKDLPYVEFSDAIKKAMADAELSDLKAINDAKGEHWQAAAWRLERKYPDRYGRKLRGTVGIGVGDGIYEDGRPEQPKRDDEPETRPVLDPRKPSQVYVTLAIGDKEVSVDDLNEDG